MADLRHLFKPEQTVYCKIEDYLDTHICKGKVKEVFENHIIVDIPDISDYCWYENGYNMDCVYPEYSAKMLGYDK